MKKEKMYCPSCGAAHEWSLPLPQSIECGNCKTPFSPIDELHRITIHICRPGEEISGFLESIYSGRSVILPRKGDKVLSKYEEYLSLSSDESLRVKDLMFEFQRSDDQSGIVRQVIYVLTEVKKDDS